jgi:hypothetical protein
MDNLDALEGWAVLVALGTARGAYLHIPALGIRIPYEPGSIMLSSESLKLLFRPYSLASFHPNCHNISHILSSPSSSEIKADNMYR